MVKYTVFDIYTVSFGILIVVILIAIGIYNYVKTKSVTSLSICILTNLTLIFYTCQTLSIVFGRLKIAQNDASCELLEFFATGFYHWSKASLYGLFVKRLTVGFKGSIHEYSNKLIIYPLFLIVTLYVSFATYFDYFFVKSEWIENEFECNPQWPLWGVYLTLLIDFIFSIICVTLFVRPLCKLANYSNNELNEPKQALRIDFLVRKYCTLVCVAIASSLTMLLLAGAFSDGNSITDAIRRSIIMIDNLFNVVCMVLLSHKHNAIYRSLCPLCIPKKFKKHNNSKPTLGMTATKSVQSLTSSR